MNDAYLKIKQNILDKKYPFLDIKNLKKKHDTEIKNLDFKFKNYIIVGIGGSSQGSKAVSSILSKENVFYFDHLSSKQINKTLEILDLKVTGLIFISKSGTTSEVLTLFDHLVNELKNKIDIYKNFLVITEKNTAPLYSLAQHMGIKIILHDSDIGGRFSIFSHTGLIPILLFTNSIDELFAGLNKSIENFLNNNYENNSVSPIILANKKYELIKSGKNICIMLFYGDELVELGNWLKQLFAESLGKDQFGYLPVVSRMTQDQHSLLQLYLDGPKDKFFEIYFADNKENNNFIDITLSNHKEAMIKTLQSEELPIINTNSFTMGNTREIFSQLGYIFSNSILEVLMIAELAAVDPFSQNAVEKQKNFLK